MFEFWLVAYPRHTIYINAPALICVKKASLQDLTAADIMCRKKFCTVVRREVQK